MNNNMENLFGMRENLCRNCYIVGPTGPIGTTGPTA